MQYTENRDRSGNLIGYWDANGKACLLSDPFVLDKDGNPTEALKEGHAITAMTQDEKDAVVAAAQANDASQAAVAYQAERAKQYPKIADQLDMLWHAIDSGSPLDKTSNFYASLAAVKVQYPKPSGA
jgi:hypothetical protein